MDSFEMFVFPSGWSMENGLRSCSADELLLLRGQPSGCVHPDCRYEKSGGSSRLPADPKVDRQRQEARSLMGSIAARRGIPTPAPILIRADAPSLLPHQRGCLSCFDLSLISV
ncbi:unnamed protein product [Penicillium glandicola]